VRKAEHITRHCSAAKLAALIGARNRIGVSLSTPAITLLCVRSIQSHASVEHEKPKPAQGLAGA